jgi:hypothetical protein
MSYQFSEMEAGRIVAKEKNACEIFGLWIYIVGF